jgi:hypothetical protein
MHRTQILLEEPRYDFLLREARRQGVSLSALVRRLITERMSGPKDEEDPLDRLTGIAADHDRHLHAPAAR